MNILILDDDYERHTKFAHALIGAKVVGVLTAQDCIDYLKAYKWDILFLDHDLDGKVYVDSRDPDTGYTVAKWLSENPSYMPNQIIIHSLNPAGAKNMHEILPGSQLVPFAWEHVKLI